MTVQPKKLIEVALPLPEINDASAYDKMPGIGAHPKGIHQWWARLPCLRHGLFYSLLWWMIPRPILRNFRPRKHKPPSASGCSVLCATSCRKSCTTSRKSTPGRVRRCWLIRAANSRTCSIPSPAAAPSRWKQRVWALWPMPPTSTRWRCS